MKAGVPTQLIRSFYSKNKLHTGKLPKTVLIFKKYISNDSRQRHQSPVVTYSFINGYEAT